MFQEVSQIVLPLKVHQRGLHLRKKKTHKKKTKLQINPTEKIDDFGILKGNCLNSVCTMVFFIVNSCKCQSSKVESFIAVQ